MHPDPTRLSCWVPSRKRLHLLPRWHTSFVLKGCLPNAELGYSACFPHQREAVFDCLHLMLLLCWKAVWKSHFHTPVCHRTLALAFGRVLSPGAASSLFFTTYTSLSPLFCLSPHPSSAPLSPFHPSVVKSGIFLLCLHASGRITEN